MKKVVSATVLLWLYCLFCLLSAQTTTITTQSLKKMPLAFTKNVGQWDEQVQYRTSSGGATIWVCRDQIVYQFVRSTRNNYDASRMQVLTVPDALELTTQESDSVEQLVFTVRFDETGAEIHAIGESILGYRANYFIGRDPGRWFTDVPNFGVVTLRDIQDGVDLCLFGDSEGLLNYQFVRTGSEELNEIEFRYEGIDPPSLDAENRYVGTTRWGSVVGVLGAPSNSGGLHSGKFLGMTGAGAMVATSPDIQSDRELHAVGLVYSSFVGGSGEDYGRAIAVDALGCAYVAGQTYSSDLPTQGGYSSVYRGDGDVFVTKMQSDGSSLVYSAYIGGTGEDDVRGIAVDQDYCAYLTGSTVSSDFAVQNAFDPSPNGNYDAFVTKLAATGSSLVYSTYLGGSNWDDAWGIAVDSLSRTYVSGRSRSANFPILAGFDESHNGSFDAFLARISTDGTSLSYSTFIGGSNGEIGTRVAVDRYGSAYATGYTNSPDFPIVSGIDSIYGGGSANYGDAFVTKVSAAGDSLIYSTFFGGSGEDASWGVAVDEYGNVYISGHTRSTDFPVLNEYDSSHNGDWDVFVSKISLAGTEILYGTYLGGTGADLCYGIDVDGLGSTFVVGYTDSPDFPMRNAYDSIMNVAFDVFAAKLSPSGSTLEYSTYLGGSGSDSGSDIAVDEDGDAVVTGSTTSSDFPTYNAYDLNPNGATDAFVGRLSSSLPGPGLLENEELISITIFEETSNIFTHTFAKNDGRLVSDINQNPPIFQNDFNGTIVEYYDVFVSDSNGVLNVHGCYLTIECYFSQNWGGVGNNIDAVRLNLVGGQSVWGTSVSSFELGSGVDPDSQGYVHRVLGPSDTLPTKMGYYYSRMTLGFGTQLPEPLIQIGSQQLEFSAFRGGDAPPAQTFTITNIATGVLNWYIDEQISWLDLDVWQGSSNFTEIAVSVNSTDLPVGIHIDTLVVFSSNATNSPQILPVSYFITPIEPIVLVHGWRGSPATWDSMSIWLGADGFQEIWALPIAPCGVDGEIQFDLNSQVLSDSIEIRRNHFELDYGYRPDTINIIAHSMGGLVSRRYASSNDPWSAHSKGVVVKNLIMLGSPNCGVPLAEILTSAKLSKCFRFPPYCLLLNAISNSLCPGPVNAEFAPSKIDLFNRNQAVNAYHSSTNFFGISGEQIIRPSPCLIFGCPNDGFIWVPSVLGATITMPDGSRPQLLDNAVNHLDVDFTPNGLFTLHSQLPQHRTIYQTRIRPELLGEPSRRADMIESAESSVKEPTSPVTSYSASYLGFLGPLTAVPETLQVLSGSRLNVVGTDFGSTMSFVLRSPTGVVYDSSYIEADSSGGYTDTGELAIYSIPNPPPGTWIIEIVAYALEDTIAPYFVVAELDDDIELNASISSSYIEAQESVFVSAVLEKAGSPISGATVVCEGYTELAEEAFSFPLKDSGIWPDAFANDGIYSAVWVPADSLGSISILVESTGEPGPFTRYASLGIFVGPDAGIVCGDADGNILVSISDVVYLIGYIFAGGPAPNPLLAGDVDCNGIVTISDAVYLINYIFAGGAAPCAACP